MGSDFYVGSVPDNGESQGVGSPAPDWQRRLNPPDNEVPVGVPLVAVVGRADGVAVALTGARVFSTGVQFDLTLHLQATPAVVRHNQAMEQFMGHQHLGPNTDRFLFGLEFADGRRAANAGGDRHPDPDPDPDPDPGRAAPALMTRGGNGGGRSFEQTMWLVPVPPAGPLIIVCSWESMGISETVTVLDGTALAEASSRVETLWPWEPEPDQLPSPEPDRESLPGWFSHFDR